MQFPPSCSFGTSTTTNSRKCPSKILTLNLHRYLYTVANWFYNCSTIYFFFKSYLSTISLSIQSARRNSKSSIHPTGRKSARSPRVIRFENLKYSASERFSKNCQILIFRKTSTMLLQLLFVHSNLIPNGVKWMPPSGACWSSRCYKYFCTTFEFVKFWFLQIFAAGLPDRTRCRVFGHSRNFPRWQTSRRVQDWYPTRR